MQFTSKRINFTGMKESKPIQTYFEPIHYDGIKRLASEKGVSLASMVRMIILDHLKKLKTNNK